MRSVLLASLDPIYVQSFDLDEFIFSTSTGDRDAIDGSDTLEASKVGNVTWGLAASRRAIWIPNT